MLHSFVDRHLSHIDQTLIIPSFIVAAKFDLQTVQPIGIDPLVQSDGITVARFVARAMRPSLLQVATAIQAYLDDLDDR